MNILHVIRDLSPLTGGPVTAVRGMAEQQARTGHAVTITSTDYGITEPPNIDSVSVRVYHTDFSRWRWSRALSAALDELVSAADIVHIHMLWEFPTWAAAAACRKTGKPYIIRPCGMLDPWALSQHSWIKKLHLLLGGQSILDHASVIHCTSDREMAGLPTSVDRTKCAVVPIGLPSAAYDNLPPREAFSNRFPQIAGKTIVLFLGRLHPKKQPDVAIRAFRLACRDRADIHLVMAGSGEDQYVGQLRRLVEELGLGKKVTFSGMLLGESVREAYAAADVFVLPSLLENFGISVAEAMAAGCAVIVSDQVYLADEIRGANAGSVCAPSDSALAAALRELLSNEPLRRQMGKDGHNLIVNRFTWPYVAKQLDNVYNCILREH